MVAERSTALTQPDEVDPKLQKELLNHAGEWVAITHDRLLAAAATASEAVERAHKLGEDSPIVYRVPDRNGAGFFF